MGGDFLFQESAAEGAGESGEEGSGVARGNWIADGWVCDGFYITETAAGADCADAVLDGMGGGGFASGDCGVVRVALGIGGADFGEAVDVRGADDRGARIDYTGALSSGAQSDLLGDVWNDGGVGIVADGLACIVGGDGDFLDWNICTDSERGEIVAGYVWSAV